MTFQEFLDQDIKIRLFPDPILREIAKEVPEFTEEVQKVCKKILDSMYKLGGIGLAAPQLGLPYKICAVNPTPNDRRKEKIFINPKIFHFGTRTSLEQEGCLSFPNIYAPVERPHKIMFTYLDIDGKPQKQCYEGMMGRICQHEIDHLTGILFTDRMTELYRAKTWSALGRK